MEVNEILNRLDDYNTFIAEKEDLEIDLNFNKDKVETFTRATGSGTSETVDKVSMAVSKQVAKVNLQGSKAVDSWQAPSGALYLLVAIPETTINKEVKNAVKTSMGNDKALWQQFQAKQALDSLEKEFPTN